MLQTYNTVLWEDSIVQYFLCNRKFRWNSLSYKKPTGQDSFLFNFLKRIISIKNELTTKLTRIKLLKRETDIDTAVESTFF